MDMTELKEQITRYLAVTEANELTHEELEKFLAWMIRLRCGHTTLHVDVETPWVRGVRMAHLALVCVDCGEHFIWQGLDGRDGTEPTSPVVSPNREVLYVPIGPTHG